MATYKQPCMHCGTLIERDSRYCHACGSEEPFGYLCPTCLKPISKGSIRCSNCGRELYITCPHCEGRTFVQRRCEICGESLMVKCSYKRCEEEQFFENKFCTACGKKIKNQLQIKKKK